MEHWIVFFLGAVIETCKVGCNTFEKILILRNEVDEEIRLSGSKGTNVNTLFRTLFQNPIVELRRKSVIEGISDRTLSRLVDEYVKKGFLVELSGKHWGRTFAFKRYLDLFKISST